MASKAIELNRVDQDRCPECIDAFQIGHTSKDALGMSGKAMEVCTCGVLDSLYPHLCPVRHLLVYIENATMEGFLLFPPTTQLTDPGKRSVGIYVKHIGYNTFDKSTRSIIGLF
ncbi:hypothetical protein MPSEU_000366100 [Mayamaea pseudoterrestris]|nr:hypothetical protein MPSEU_000366100 [Mayamaea pseudoterrestris]